MSLGSQFNIVDFNEFIEARYIRITVAGEGGVGNYGDTNFAGLSEVQVFEVPEPSTLVLALLGLHAATEKIGRFSRQ